MVVLTIKKKWWLFDLEDPGFLHIKVFHVLLRLFLVQILVFCFAFALNS